jgi:hypothetical protein
MSILGIIGAGLQLALILAQFIINKINTRDADVEGAFKDGINAIKNRDSGAFNFAIQRLRRLRNR